jgi:hypothetical protein
MIDFANYTLTLTGEHSGRGFLVTVDGEGRRLASQQHEFLAELVIACKSTETGNLYISQCLSTRGNKGTNYQVAKRLRKELGEPRMVETSCSAYRLTCEPSRIYVAKAMLELPSTIFDPRILARLKPFIGDK